MRPVAIPDTSEEAIMDYVYRVAIEHFGLQTTAQCITWCGVGRSRFLPSGWAHYPDRALFALLFPESPIRFH